MLKHIILSTTISLLASPAFANGPELLIEDFVGTVKVENSGSDKISITRKENIKGVNFITQGRDLKIDGGIEKPDGSDCKSYYGKYNITLFKKNGSGEFGGYENLEDYPQLTIQAPEDAVMIIRNSIPFLTGENFGEADLELSSCGKVTLGDVSGDLRSNIRGSADLKAEDVGAVDIDIRGSGDVVIESAEFVSLSVAGSGDAEFGNVQGANVSVSGSGDIQFDNIDGSFAAESRGSGDIEAEDITGDFIYDAGGSGDLDIGSVTGHRLSIAVSGSGDVDIDDGNVASLQISASGASEVSFDGTAENADLVATGASDIYVNKVTGEVRSKERGAADIDVNN